MRPVIPPFQGLGGSVSAGRGPTTFIGQVGANIAIPDNTDVIIQYDTVVQDPGGWYNAGTGDFTMPAGHLYYFAHSWAAQPPAAGVSTSYGYYVGQAWENAPGTRSIFWTRYSVPLGMTDFIEDTFQGFFVTGAVAKTIQFYFSAFNIGAASNLGDSAPQDTELYIIDLGRNG